MAVPASDISRAVAHTLKLLSDRGASLDRIKEDTERAHKSLLADLAERREEAQNCYIEYANEHCPHTNVSRDRSSEYARRSQVLYCCDTCGIRIIATEQEIRERAHAPNEVLRDITNTEARSYKPQGTGSH